MASYGSSIQRTAGADPLVRQPLSRPGRTTVATPDMATMRNLQKQGKAMPPQQAGGRPRFQIRNADDLDNAVRAVGRVRPNTEEARAKVRRFIASRARALGLTSRLPDSWNADGTLKSPGD